MLSAKMAHTQWPRVMAPAVILSIAHVVNAVNLKSSGGALRGAAGNSTPSLYPSLSDFESLKTNTNYFFDLICSMIIFLMQAGFAFLEAGAVRSKNTTNILLKNTLDAFISCLSYWAIGYAFAHGNGDSFIGYSFWFGSYPEDQAAKWFFQFVFAATAAGIVSGALAERCNFYAYLVYSSLLTAFIYPIVSRWAWYSNSDGNGIGGWLADNHTVIDGVSFQDFSGSGVVHLLGGTAAFVGAIFLGPRIGRFAADGSVIDIPGHSVPLTTLGGLILIFGFFAFNGGSSFSIAEPNDGVDVSEAVVNTMLAGSSAAVTSMLLRYFLHKVKEGCHKAVRTSPWSLLTLINGSLAGMVAICAGCNTMAPWGSFLTGFIVAFVYIGMSNLVLKLRIDDPLDAVAVHFGGGLWGLLAAPLFDHKLGILVKGDRRSGQQLAVNIVGALAIMSWTAVTCTLLFATLRCLRLLRVSEEWELKGLDIPKHHEPAYPSKAYGDGWGDAVMTSQNRPGELNQIPDDDDPRIVSSSRTHLVL